MAPKQNLTTRVVISSAWLLSFQIFDNLLGVVRIFLIARVLTPADFGLVGIAMLTKQILDTFTQTGIISNLIYRSDTEKYLNTAWTFLLFRGIAMGTLVYFAAPYFAMFFNSPDSVLIIRAIGFTFVIEACTNIGTVLFPKHLEFRKVFTINLIGNITDAVVAISLAYILQNAWAVVFGAMLNSSVRMVASYILSRYRPSFEFSLTKFKDMAGYGKWIAGSSILQFLYSQADDILVGRMLGTTALGYYQLAYRISNLPATQISHIVGNVMFPAYTIARDNLKKISDAYVSGLRLIASISIPIGIIIILFARDFTSLVLGEQWLPMVPALQVLSIWGIIRSLGATTGSLWQALGTPQITTKIQFVQTLLMALTIYPLTLWYGYTGTAVAVVLSAIVVNIYSVFRVSLSVSTPVFTITKEILYPLLGCTIMYVTFNLLQQTFIAEPTFLLFGIKAVLVGVTYVAAVVFLAKVMGYRLFETVQSVTDRFPLNDRLKKAVVRFCNLAS